ncbi:unnamed protein product [Owenia fusiformis]|uniref:Uncharacterized protein n=1 Tax=Owenia fusiformis TaxID=6347 RepID=A0A8J1TJB5_OWEFU|nr:unnamed protein product [Owenia fusiformis]
MSTLMAQVYGGSSQMGRLLQQEQRLLGREMKGESLPNIKQTHDVKDSEFNNNDVTMKSQSYHFAEDFFRKEPCLYSHNVFMKAGQVFASLRHEAKEENALIRKRQEQSDRQQIKLPDIDFESEGEKRLVFDLAFSALKYQDLLEVMLDDCAFFSLYSEFKDDEGIVMVMLYDFQHRKFQQRTPLRHEILDDELTDIEKALNKCKTKMNASLARNRIKSSALSLDHLLPDNVRKNEEVSVSLPIFAWVNLIKTSVSLILDSFRDEGFTVVGPEDPFNKRTLSVDPHCNDVLVFSSIDREFLMDHVLVREGHLILQDKSSCLGPHSIKALLNDGDDVLHVNVGSGATTAHLSSLTQNTDTNIVGLGVKSDKHLREIKHKLSHLGAKNVKMYSDDIADIEADDPRFKHIKIVLMSAECSRSGITNPVDFIVNEGEDMTILKDLSKGQVDDEKIGELVVKHNTQLRNAMKFPKVQAVVYTTRSVHDVENDVVVGRATEYVNMTTKQTPFRVVPPVLPLAEKDIEDEGALVGKYLKFQPTERMSGCFLAVISREAEDPKEAAKDILARAAAQGLLGSSQDTGKKSQSQTRSTKSGRLLRKKSAPRRAKSLHHPRSSPTHKPEPPAGALGSATATPTTTKSLHKPKIPKMSVGSISQRLYNTNRSRNPHSIANPTSKTSTPEHVRIVQHPKPFSFPEPERT